MAQDPYRYFRPEARNLLDQFAQGILEIEKNGDGAGAVQRLLRLAHTLKGAARVVRQSSIAEHAHAIEDALAPFRDHDSGIARESIDTILTHLDEISSQIATLVPGDGPDGSAGSKTATGDAPASGTAKIAAETPANPVTDAQRVIRADIKEMDGILDGVSETYARLGRLRRNAEAIEQIGHLAELLSAQLGAQGGIERGRGAGGSAHLATVTAEELRRKIGGLADEFDSAVGQVERELRQLREAAESLKLVAVDNVLMALKRTARDAARSLSKQVTFEGTGGDIRLDADVLGTIQGALIQIVRNAVAHGIEPAGDRLAAGKPATGRISVNVTRRGRKIEIKCHDDGRGIDLAAVRRVAQERGLLSATASNLTAEDLVRVLLRGGVSTSTSVTDVAGRGVGLDVVREALDRLGGEISVNIEAGRGTTFHIVIPRSVTSIATLIVEAETGDGAVAMPLDAVRRIVRVAAGDIASASTGPSILHENAAVPFIPLAAALNGSGWSVVRAWTAVIIAGTGGTAAIGVERLLGTANTVVRPLPDGLGASPILAGASLDGDGNPQLILDPDGLVAAAAGVRAAEPKAPPGKRPVLVVDDSLTTRMLEKSILESAGYDVDVASSGEEGLDLLRHKAFALILCDVEMPGIDGFTFVERVRADPVVRNVPAILVSSRSAPEDRRRGHDAGAQGYIVKSEFNQAELLAMIRPMVG